VTTSPDSVSYPDQGYGILGPLPAYVINIQDVPGADPTGNNDSTLAINTALASLPDEGGQLTIAPGVYKFSDRLVMKSNAVMNGSGTLLAAPPAEWSGTPTYLCIVNENNTASVITDENITISGITLDMSAHGTSGVNIHGIYMRKAGRVVIEGVTVIGGSSSVALLGCDDTQEIGNKYLNFTNCGSDHWDGPANARLIGCHLECDVSAQMVNWNPEATVPPSAGLSANGFTMTGNTLVSHEASTTPCQIEPLGTSGTFVRDVTVTGNTFKNVWVLFRGNVDGVVFSGNVMSDFASGSPAVVVQPYVSGTPGSVLITGNTIRDAITIAGNAGVIYADADQAVVANNAILGTAYASLAVYRGSSACQVMANDVEYAAARASNRLQTGVILPNGLTNLYGWTDASGTFPRMYLQSDNNWIFEGTNASGAARVALSMLMRSSTSDLIASVPVQFSSPYRTVITTVAAAGTVIGTSTVLTGNVHNVTTCTAGVADGVQLTATTGRPQTVINTSAATLKVYPNAGGSAQIDAGGVDVPTTIVAGKSKTFIQVTAGDFRTVAAT
jgi:hypothetical protein